MFAKILEEKEKEISARINLFENDIFRTVRRFFLIPDESGKVLRKICRAICPLKSFNAKVTFFATHFYMYSS